MDGRILIQNPVAPAHQATLDYPIPFLHASNDTLGATANGTHSGAPLVGIALAPPPPAQPSDTRAGPPTRPRPALPPARRPPRRRARRHRA